MDSNNALRLKKAPSFTNILENEILLNDVRLNIFYCITGSSKWIKKKIINKLEYEIGKKGKGGNNFFARVSKRVYKSVFRAVTELEDARPFQFVKPDTFFAEKSRERMKNCVFARRGVSRELFPSLNSPPVPYAPRH